MPETHEKTEKNRFFFMANAINIESSVRTLSNHHFPQNRQANDDVRPSSMYDMYGVCSLRTKPTNNEKSVFFSLCSQFCVSNP